MQREASLNGKAYSERDEKRTLDALGRGLLKEFPNPDRAGCPGSDVLRRIASHEMPLPEAEKWLDHLTSCSPCYRDFLELQVKYGQRRTRMLFAVAASILVMVGLATWGMLRQHNQQIARVLVDLRDRSMARGTEPSPTEPPVEIPRNVSHLEIYLPLGSTEGPYDVRLTTVRSDLVVSAHGEAQLERGITVLRVDLNSPSPGPGRYILQIRRPPSGWASFALEVR